MASHPIDSERKPDMDETMMQLLMKERCPILDTNELFGVGRHLPETMALEEPDIFADLEMYANSHDDKGVDQATELPDVSDTDEIIRKLWLSANSEDPVCRWLAQIAVRKCFADAFGQDDSCDAQDYGLPAEEVPEEISSDLLAGEMGWDANEPWMRSNHDITESSACATDEFSDPDIYGGDVGGDSDDAASRQFGEEQKDAIRAIICAGLTDKNKSVREQAYRTAVSMDETTREILYLSASSNSGRKTQNRILSGESRTDAKMR